MAKQQASITLTEGFMLKDGGGSTLAYLIVQAVNTIDFRINQALSPAEVQALIDGGMKVTIKSKA